MGKRQLLNTLTSISQNFNLPPDWVNTQDTDTIKYLGEEAKKKMEADAAYKKLLVEAIVKKVF